MTKTGDPVSRPDPQHTIRSLQCGEHRIAGEAVLDGVRGEAAVLEMIEPAPVSPEPEALLPISGHRPDDVLGEPLTPVIDGENRLAEAVEAAGPGSYPEASFQILEERSDGIIRQAVPGSEPLEPPSGKPREPATVRTDPELAVPGPTIALTPPGGRPSAMVKRSSFPLAAR